MNKICMTYLDKFVVVFTDYILIYSQTNEDMQDTQEPYLKTWERISYMPRLASVIFDLID